MKLAVVLGIAALAPAIGAALAYAQDAPRTRSVSVSVAVTTAAVRETPSTRTDALLLWNRNKRSLPIGHAIKSCLKAGAGGIFGQGLMSCLMTVSLPLGKVTAAGVVHDIRRYTLVITGGTGAYESAHGPLFVRSVSGDGVRRLTFSVS